MKVKHWAAIASLSLGLFTAAPAFARYPLYPQAEAPRQPSTPPQTRQPGAYPAYRAPTQSPYGASMVAPSTTGSTAMSAGMSAAGITAPGMTPGSEGLPSAPPLHSLPPASQPNSTLVPGTPAEFSSLRQRTAPRRVQPQRDGSPPTPQPAAPGNVQPMPPMHPTGPMAPGGVNPTVRERSAIADSAPHDPQLDQEAPVHGWSFDSTTKLSPPNTYYPARPRRHRGQLLRGYGGRDVMYWSTPTYVEGGHVVEGGHGVESGQVVVNEGEQFELGVDACGPPPARSPWYGSIDGLLLTRDNENEVWFSYDTDDITSQTLGSLDAHLDWRFGADLRFGKYYDEGRRSLEFAYWGILAATREANAYGSAVVANLDASLTFDSLEYDPGTGAAAVSTFYNNAERHRLIRNYRAHNAEFNAWRHCVTCLDDSKKNASSARLSWMWGLRYMNYNEGFQFWSDTNDAVFGNDTQEELVYRVNIDNHLLGFQMGGMSEVCLNDRWQFNATAKTGVLFNFMDLDNYIGSIHRPAQVNNVASPYHGQQWVISSSKEDVSLLGELDLGLRYRWNERLNITSGYRVIGLSGIGLATNQVPNYFANVGGVRHIDGNGSLILHGFYYVGGEYNY